MNRTVLLSLTVSFCVSCVFGQANEWDSNNFNYDGAFGLAAGGTPDWSTATDIWTVRTPATNDTPSGPLGYLRLRNQQNTIVTVTNSFTGQIVVANGGTTLVAITNRIVSQDSGVTISGAASGVAGGATALPGSALSVAGFLNDTLILQEGHYVGGENKSAILATGIQRFEVLGTKINGGKGESISSNGVGNISSGASGIFTVSSLDLVINGRQVEEDAIRGGDGGDDLTGQYDSASTANGVGGIGITRLAANQRLAMDNGYVVGGSGGTMLGVTRVTSFDLTGGVGISVASGHAELNQGQVHGGNGGTFDGDSTGAASMFSGGSGVFVKNTAFSQGTTIRTAQLYGGKGGDVTFVTMTNTTDISGGNALVISAEAAGKTNYLYGTQATGGNAGTLVTSTSTTAVVTGGKGFLISGNGAASSGMVSVSGGTYTGGDGGTVTHDFGTPDVSGGQGALVENSATVEIGGNATFTGGNAGTINGTDGQRGVGLEVRDAVVIITNGTFSGRKGLLTSTPGGDGNDITILGGSFGDVEFGGDNETITISGGAMDEILLTGPGTKNLAVSGAMVDRFSVADGIVNFAQSFDLLSGTTFELQDGSGVANFNSGLTIKDGSTLAVGNGAQVSGSSFVTEPGSLFVIYKNDTANGLISVSGNATITNGTKGLVHGGDAVIPEGSTFTLIESTSGNLLSLITADDVQFTDNRGTWLQGVAALTTNATSLIATYDDLRIEYALGLDGNTEFGRAMNDLTTVVHPESTGHALLSSINGRDEAESVLNSAYMYTPEMANTLLQLSDVFSGRVTDRGRSFRQQDVVSAPQGAGGPREWYGNVKLWLDDHLPSFDSKEASEGVNDRLPAFDSKAVSRSLGAEVPLDKISRATRELGERAPHAELEDDSTYISKSVISDAPKKKSKRRGSPKKVPITIELPSSYQSWGQAFGSYLEQNAVDGFMGYDAVIGGALVGMDRRFNNLLVGLGAGYSYTDLHGNNLNHATADTGHGVVYASHNGEGGFIDANISYAYNDVQTKGDTFLGYTGEYAAQSISGYLGGGFDVSTLKDTLIFTPEASLLATYFMREAYTESSPLLPSASKRWDSYDQSTYVSSLGATLAMKKRIDHLRLEMAFRPELHVHWLHDFNADFDDSTYSLKTGSSIHVDHQAREEDLIKVGGGVRLSKWASDTLEFGVYFDAVLGEDYSSYTASGKMNHRF